MQYFLCFIVALWLVFGLGLLIIPEFMRNVYMRKFNKIKNPKLLCLLPLGGGILFFLAVKNLKIGTFGYALGIVAIFKGLYFLVIKKDRIKQIFGWWLNAPHEFLRIWGTLLIALALILLSLIR